MGIVLALSLSIVGQLFWAWAFVKEFLNTTLGMRTRIKNAGVAMGIILFAVFLMWAMLTQPLQPDQELLATVKDSTVIRIVAKK